MLIQDDTYQDYFLPKRTIFLMNVWGIHREENEYGDFYDFILERRLGNNLGTKNPVEDDNNRRVRHGSGAGRRVCAGQKLAENSQVRFQRLCRVFEQCADETI